MKHCACTRVISPASWARLPLIGIADNGREQGELLELRTCSCGSTLAKAVGTHAPESKADLPIAPSYERARLRVLHVARDPYSTRPTCSSCGKESPDTDTSYALIGAAGTRARKCVIDAVMESRWRCPDCAVKRTGDVPSAPEGRPLRAPESPVRHKGD